MVDTELKLSHKRFLLNCLVDKFDTEKHRIIKELSDFFRNILKSKFISADLQVFLDDPDCDKICLRGNCYTRLELKDIGIESCYPSNKAPYVYNSCLVLNVDFPSIPAFNLDKEVKDILKNLSEDELDIVRNLVSQYLENDFKESFEYTWDGEGYMEFLQGIKTWKDLYKLNEDWYYIVYNEFISTVNLNPVESMKGLDISEKIKKLRNVLNI